MIERLQRTVGGRNALLNIFEMWVALAGVISGVIFFWSPASIDDNALSQTIGHSLSEVWNIAYFVSGIVIWVGLLRPSPRWEIAGLFILGSATSINGVAITSVFGLRGTATAATLFTLAVAAWLRAGFVMRTAARLIEERDDRAARR